MKYIVDTNIFNKLIDGKILIQDLPTDGQFVATHVQIDEINNTKNKERRAQLFLVFATFSPAIVPTETFILDVSRLDQAKLGEGVLYQAILNDLGILNGNKSNNIQDALIAEVAAANGFTLLTADSDLAKVAEVHKIRCSFFYDN